MIELGLPGIIIAAVVAMTLGYRLGYTNGKHDTEAKMVEAGLAAVRLYLKGVSQSVEYRTGAFDVIQFFNTRIGGQP